MAAELHGHFRLVVQASGEIAGWLHGDWSNTWSGGTSRVVLNYDAELIITNSRNKYTRASILNVRTSCFDV